MNIIKYWNKFEDLLDRKRFGECINDDLKLLAAEAVRKAGEICNKSDYQRLSNLFYHIQEVLLFEYGDGYHKTFPSNPCLLGVNHSDITKNS